MYNAFYQKHEYAIISTLLAISFLFPILFWDGFYHDTDNFIHAWRVYDLMTQHHWGEQLLMKSNFPFGEVIHYTRIMDFIWMLIALPLAIFMPVKQAVFTAGLIFQPFIAVMTACAIIWAVRPVFNPLLRLFIVFYFFCQNIIAQLYVFARPDHHTLVAFFTFIILGYCFRYLKDHDEKRMKMAGIFSGVLLWTSIEGLLLSYAMLAPFLLLWLWDGRFLKACRTFALYYFISGTICLMINPPYEGFFHPDNGRISFLTLVLTAMTYVSLSATDYLNDKKNLTSFWKRLTALVLPAVISLALMLLCMGKTAVFGNPFTPEIKAWYLSVSELRPAIRFPALFRFFAFHATIALILLIVLFKPTDKEILLLTGIPLIFFTLLTYRAIRFSQHASVFLIFPAAYALTELLKKMKAHFKKDFETKTVVFVLSLALAGFCIEFMQKDALFNMQGGYRYNTLPFIPYLSPKEGAVLSRVFNGSEIIWTTERPVISTPNHRNIEGIVDTYAIYFGNDMKEVRRLLEKRHITTIFMPPDIYSLNPLTRPRNNDFAVRLIENKDIPCGISLAPDLPDQLKEHSLVFHVDFDACPSI